MPFWIRNLECTCVNNRLLLCIAVCLGVGFFGRTFAQAPLSSVIGEVRSVEELTAERDELRTRLNRISGEWMEMGKAVSSSSEELLVVQNQLQKLTTERQQDEKRNLVMVQELDELKKDHLRLASTFSETLKELADAKEELLAARKKLAAAEQMIEKKTIAKEEVESPIDLNPAGITLKEEVQTLRTRLAAAERNREGESRAIPQLSEQTARMGELQRQLQETDRTKVVWAQERASLERQAMDLRAQSHASSLQRDEDARSWRKERDQLEVVHAKELNALKVLVAEAQARQALVVTERDAANVQQEAQESGRIIAQDKERLAGEIARRAQEELAVVRKDLAASEAAGTSLLQAQALWKLEMDRMNKDLADRQSLLENGVIAQKKVEILSEQIRALQARLDDPSLKLMEGSSPASP